jgi:hypothetical protein
MGNRIKAAVDFLKDGKSFRIDDIRLGLIEFGVIEVAGWSQYVHIENITKNRALQELDEIKALFSQMVESSPELKDFIQGKNIVYSLYYDDYGKASINVCTEKTGILEWGLNLEQ